MFTVLYFLCVCSPCLNQYATLLDECHLYKTKRIPPNGPDRRYRTGIAGEQPDHLYPSADHPLIGAQGGGDYLRLQTYAGRYDCPHGGAYAPVSSYPETAGDEDRKSVVEGKREG